MGNTYRSYWRNARVWRASTHCPQPQRGKETARLLCGYRCYRAGTKPVTPTTLLVTSFVAQDLVALTPALVIVLGADVGTALMARILTFDLSWLSPLLIFIGVIFFFGT
ncbi:Sodium-dependent phosphate transporter [Salmonella enterica subsp. enterica]|uniref:Sodium-dependent phosphate transporter n=1 Tax=Salmonella enterica I TaxID=59201 RepID=A0A447MZZ0_SALET|nr:Sodium-dependent phosphate transporter [Salmonella enterica subsp. enterica]